MSRFTFSPSISISSNTSSELISDGEAEAGDDGVAGKSATSGRMDDEGEEGVTKISLNKSSIAESSMGEE